MKKMFRVFRLRLQQLKTILINRYSRRVLNLSGSKNIAWECFHIEPVLMCLCKNIFAIVLDKHGCIIRSECIIKKI